MITDEMVIKAWNAFEPDSETHDGMRSALEAGCGKCIDDLAAALLLVIKWDQRERLKCVDIDSVENIDGSCAYTARATLARWGLEK